jgi:hypothetical protein
MEMNQAEVLLMDFIGENGIMNAAERYKAPHARRGTRSKAEGKEARNNMAIASMTGKLRKPGLHVGDVIHIRKTKKQAYKKTVKLYAPYPQPQKGKKYPFSSKRQNARYAGASA